MPNKNLNIYYSCNQYPSYSSNVWCSRWDEDNYSIIMEYIIESGSAEDIPNNIVPGAVTELYNILGTPYYQDTTYNSGNTLIFDPVVDFGLSSNLRVRRTIAVKNYSSRLLNDEIYLCKIEGFRLDI